MWFLGLNGLKKITKKWKNVFDNFVPGGTPQNPQRRPLKPPVKICQTPFFLYHLLSPLSPKSHYIPYLDVTSLLRHIHIFPRGYRLGYRRWLPNSSYLYFWTDKYKRHSRVICLKEKLTSLLLGTNVPTMKVRLLLIVREPVTRLVSDFTQISHNRREKGLASRWKIKWKRNPMINSPYCVVLWGKLERFFLGCTLHLCTQPGKVATDRDHNSSSKLRLSSANFPVTGIQYYPFKSITV